MTRTGTVQWIDGQIEALERQIKTRGDGGSKEQRAALARMQAARAKAQIEQRATARKAPPSPGR